METQCHFSSFLYSLSFFLFLSLLLPSFSLAATIRCNPNDKKVLMQIKESLNNPSQLASWSWTSTTDCCNWSGINCLPNTNRVSELTIPQANIAVQFPAAVGDLPYLKTIIFDKLNLFGIIPSSLAKLKNLVFLSISGNKLSGPIPEFLSQFKNLEYLDLSSNQFSGPIPASLSNLKNILVFNLDRNKLTGKIPDSFGDIISGRTLQLSYNQLSGEIPKSLSNMKFESISLEYNKLVGDASMLFNTNSPTTYINISNNKLKFDFSNLKFPKNLTSLLISHNMIFGSIPKAILDADLFFLDVSYNHLCGEIPVGGRLQEFQPSAYSNNRCLCGPPLAKCK